MNRQELAERIYLASHRTGRFRLRSGIESDEYFDKYQFETEPALLHDVCTALAPLIPTAAQVLAGLELGGVPIATVLGQIVGLPVVFVRKTAKNYGTCQLAEGAAIEGKNLLIVEDVITTGGQVAQSAQELRSRGAIVKQALCVIDRRSGERDKLAAAEIELTALFRFAELRSAS